MSQLNKYNLESTLYANLRYLRQNIYISTKGYFVRKIKLSKQFYEVLNNIEESQWYSRQELEDLQNKKLRKLIKYAYEYVPYYRKIFDKNNIKSKDIDSKNDLFKIPFLTKEILRANSSDLVSKCVNKRLLASGWTTGSTGTPINALRDKYSIVFENAMIWRQRRWAGVNPDAKKAAIWGTIWSDVIVPSKIKSPPFWCLNVSDNQLLLSYYHLSEETLPLYIDKLRKFSPEFIEGFPSVILILAKYLKKIDEYLPLKAIFTSSEPLYAIHRKDIEERFKCRVFDLYGQAERVISATDCEKHQGLHVNPEYGVLEIKEDHKLRDKKLITGEIIGTSLNNFAMPLIRYCTGDISTISSERCSCGRNMQLLESIEGRKTDSILTPSGKIIPGGGIMGAFHGISNIKRSQIIQNDINKIQIKLELEDMNQNVNTDKLRANILNCINDNEIDINIKVEKISIDQVGKFKWVISTINAN